MSVFFKLYTLKYIQRNIKTLDSATIKFITSSMHDRVWGLNFMACKLETDTFSYNVLDDTE